MPIIDHLAYSLANLNVSGDVDERTNKRNDK